MIGIGVIGYGYWGPNLVRNFFGMEGATVVGVSDMRPERLGEIERRYPTIKTTTNYRDLIGDPKIDAIVIATPVSTHFELAMQAIRAGKHVFIEKPLAGTVEQAERLVDEAARCRRILMVDHTFVYTGAVQKIKELIDAGRLGQLYYYDSVRVNLGLFQYDVNVVWDLAVHDLSIMDYILGARPRSISAIGMAHVPGQPKDVAYLTCIFDSNLIAHFHANWLAPVKIRRTLIGGDQRMVVYDDLEPSEKIKVYDRGITLNNGSRDAEHQLLIGYRSGDMWAPKLEAREALSIGAKHFLDCIEHQKQPLTDGESGLRVVRILEAAMQSINHRGRPTELFWDR